MASILCAAFQIVVLATAAESYTDLNRELVEGVYASIFCELLEVEHVPRNRHDQLVPPTAEVNLLLVNMQKQTVECFNPGEVYDIVITSNETIIGIAVKTVEQTGRTTSNSFGEFRLTTEDMLYVNYFGCGYPVVVHKNARTLKFHQVKRLSMTWVAGVDMSVKVLTVNYSIVFEKLKYYERLSIKIPQCKPMPLCHLAVKALPPIPPFDKSCTYFREDDLVYECQPNMPNITCTASATEHKVVHYQCAKDKGKNCTLSKTNAPTSGGTPNTQDEGHRGRKTGYCSTLPTPSPTAEVNNNQVDALCTDILDITYSEQSAVDCCALAVN